MQSVSYCRKCSQCQQNYCVCLLSKVLCISCGFEHQVVKQGSILLNRVIKSHIQESFGHHLTADSGPIIQCALRQGTMHHCPIHPTCICLFGLLCVCSDIGSFLKRLDSARGCPWGSEIGQKVSLSSACGLREIAQVLFRVALQILRRNKASQTQQARWLYR